MATPGLATAPDLAAELFKMMTGVDIVVVRYRGSPAALTDLIGGQVETAFDAVLTSIDHLRTGQLRALAVASPTRLEVLPNIPTVANPRRTSRRVAGVGFAGPRPRRRDRRSSQRRGQRRPHRS